MWDIRLSKKKTMTIGPKGARKVKLQIDPVQFGPLTINCFNLILQILKSNQFYHFLVYYLFKILMEL